MSFKKFKKKELFSDEHVQYIIKKFCAGARKDIKDYHLAKLEFEEDKLRRKTGKLIIENPDEDKHSILRRKKRRKKLRKRLSQRKLPIIDLNKKLVRTDFFKKESKEKRYHEQNNILDGKIELVKKRKKILQIQKMEETKLKTMRGDIRVVSLTLKKAFERESKKKESLHKKWIIFLNSCIALRECKKVIHYGKIKKKNRMRKISICAWVAKKFEIYVHGINQVKFARISRNRIENAMKGELDNFQPFKEEMSLNLFGNEDDIVNQRKCGKFVQASLALKVGVLRGNIAGRAKVVLGKVLKKLCSRLLIKVKLNAYRLNRKIIFFFQNFS